MKKTGDVNQSAENERDEKYSDILNYEWTESSLANRMPLSQRAKIFLPFSALTGFNEALEDTLRSEIQEFDQKTSVDD
ncbi:MAG: hypothetical protein II114_03480 [Treponema sp.]|nr:hypothetical protein [Treponema sp.]